MPSNPIMVTVMMEPRVASLWGAVSMTATPNKAKGKGISVDQGESVISSHQRWFDASVCHFVSHLAQWSIPQAWNFPNENHYGASLSPTSSLQRWYRISKPSHFKASTQPSSYALSAHTLTHNTIECFHWHIKLWRIDWVRGCDQSIVRIISSGVSSPDQLGSYTMCRYFSHIQS